MKKNLIAFFLLSGALIIKSDFGLGQSEPDYKNDLNGLPKHLKLVEKTPQKYLMTSEYFNRDIYGNLGSKVKVTGEYTRGLDSGYVCWNNVFIAHAGPVESYSEGKKQDNMENIKYIPSSHLLDESFFQNFPDNPENVFSKNLIWDVMAIEGYAWNYFDSLDLNKTYTIPDIPGNFDMAGIGTYQHSDIELNWIGISLKNNELCAVIEYRALDNRLQLSMNEMKSEGSEFYWGKTWVSLTDMQIEYAEMYSNTIQEMDIQGLPQKILVSTKRILTLEKIN